jgi:hypothetical protein
MKRRNFLSGLLAAALALKARILALFQKRPVELCGAPIFLGAAEQPEQPQPKPAQSWRGVPLSAARNQTLTSRQREVVQLLAEGKSMKEAPGTLGVEPPTPARQPDRKPLLFCSLPRGHKGPHMLVNRQVKLTRLSFGDGQHTRGSLS